MTVPAQILALWGQGYDTHEIARRVGVTEAVAHREIIRERTQRLARRLSVGGAA